MPSATSASSTISSIDFNGVPDSIAASAAIASTSAWAFGDLGLELEAEHLAADLDGRRRERAGGGTLGALGLGSRR